MNQAVRSIAAADASSPLFALDPRVVEIWDRMQKLQTDYCYHSELPAYFLSPEWRGAESVLDVGAGNGYYLARLMKLFPEKRYCGADSNPDLVAFADHAHGAHNAEFVCAPFDEVEGDYDYIIMRLFMQHMSDVDAVLAKARSLLRENGALLIIDAWDPARLYSPDMPCFMAFFHAYARTCARRGLGRDVTDRVRKAVENSGDWRIARENKIVVSSAIPGNLELFRESYALFIELVERTNALAYDFQSVRDEWRWWCGLDAAYTQAGLAVLELSPLAKGNGRAA